MSVKCVTGTKQGNVINRDSEIVDSHEVDRKRNMAEELTFDLTRE